MTDCDKCKEYDKEKNYCPVFCNVINDTLTDKAIEELEKIKAEIRERANECQDYQTHINGLMYTQTYINGLMYTYTIIDKYISELKGK